MPSLFKGILDTVGSAALVALALGALVKLLRGIQTRQHETSGTFARKPA